MTIKQQLLRQISNLDDVISTANDPDTIAEFIHDAPDIRRVLLDVMKTMEVIGR